jgi:hypothetical protein
MNCEALRGRFGTNYAITIRELLNNLCDSTLVAKYAALKNIHNDPTAEMRMELIKDIAKERDFALV